MLVAHVILDISTKALDNPYRYLIEKDDLSVEVGCAVLVSFGSRDAIGFVTLIEEDADTDGLKSIIEVLTKPYFDGFAVECAEHISKRYIAPLNNSLRLFLPKGGIPKLKKDSEGNTVIVKPMSKELNQTLITQGVKFESFKPRKNAFKQIRIMEVLEEGEIALSELKLLYGDVTSAIRSLQREDAIKVINERKYRTDPLDSGASYFNNYKRPEKLTEHQMNAIKVIDQAIADDDGKVVLIDGVTGSGKTEVYLNAIEKVLKRGEDAIVLVPEISLTPQTLARFRMRFGDTVALLHSKMSPGERFDQFDLIRNGSCRVVIGARSALFSPVRNLGLVIIDEEHETTYKQESSPKYNAKEVAEWMIKKKGKALILGSATPSIESLYRSKTDPSWLSISLPERANGKKMPDIDIIDMTKSGKGDKDQILSKELTDAIKVELDLGHKVVLLLNQRGFSRFMLCRDCGFVPECRNCSTTLTYHEDGNRLACHHCGLALKAPARCPVCNSPYIKKLGYGTERLEKELRYLLDADTSIEPNLISDVEGTSERRDVKIIRMDADTTSKKGLHQQLLEEFGSADAAVLLGTQMIAKGLDFDEVTLVGVVNADTQLHIPDFRSYERTFDLIEQVAGRAGRADLSGKVLVQTFEPDNVAIQAAANYDRELFLRSELPKRKVLGFPPFVRMANVLIWGRDEDDVKKVSYDIHGKLEKMVGELDLSDWEILPTGPCVFERIRRDHRWHIVIKSPLRSDLSNVLYGFFSKFKHDRTVNVSVDIDPVDLL